jgi:transposase
MEKKKSNRVRFYDSSFKLEVLTTCFSTSESMRSIARRYGISNASISKWILWFETGSKSLSLSDDLLNKLSEMRKKRLEKENQESNDPEVLKKELIRLRKALEYSELRNEALNEVLKIGRDEYGIDLLKKAGAKQ